MTVSFKGENIDKEASPSRLHGLVPIRERVGLKQYNIRMNKLEDIPEETELPVDYVPELEEARLHLETDLKVLRMSMDMGIWALCLGFGFILSRTARF
ncbi:hypothetical protein VNO78_22407 [Psophocarpus tetragonolobus]|uniref:Uncharacterized protein n=1 Tax=Psophocarpus tetragonolobus TaxID=3891 RepID=A0AAN9SH08_PSOTE